MTKVGGLVKDALAFPRLRDELRDGVSNIVRQQGFGFTKHWYLPYAEMHPHVWESVRGLTSEEALVVNAFNVKTGKGLDGAIMAEARRRGMISVGCRVGASVVHPIPVFVLCADHLKWNTNTCRVIRRHQYHGAGTIVFVSRRPDPSQLYPRSGWGGAPGVEDLEWLVPGLDGHARNLKVDPKAVRDYVDALHVNLLIKVGDGVPGIPTDALQPLEKLGSQDDVPLLESTREVIVGIAKKLFRSHQDRAAVAETLMSGHLGIDVWRRLARMQMERRWGASD
ncbi:hypothetical protein [Deinococcus yunweiensis]|uniref:hypothetical protein n=1 Tax=Deinococcus yunweiensis TaxID=367282 RepID=UPI00398EE397